MKEQLMDELHRTASEFLEALSGFSEEQINQLPFEGSWSAAQVAAHMYKSDTGAMVLLEGETEPSGRKPDEKLEQIKRDFLNFDLRFTSPEIVRPEIRDYEKEELLRPLSQMYQRIEATAGSLNLSEICLAYPFPVYGFLSRLEVLAFINYHTQRHLHQLKNIYEIIIKKNGNEKERADNQNQFKRPVNHSENHSSSFNKNI